MSPVAVAQVTRAAAALAWVARSLRRVAPTPALAGAVLSALGVASRTLTVSTLLLFIHARTDERVPTVMGMELPVDLTPLVTMGWATAILTAAVLTAIFAYGAELRAMTASRCLQAHVLKSTIQAVSAGLIDPPALASTDPASSRSSLAGDSTMIVRAGMIAQGLVTPALMLAASLVVLFALNATLSAAVLLLCGGYAVPFYLLSRDVARASREYEELRTSRSGVLRRVLQYATGTYAAADSSQRKDLDEALEDPALEASSLALRRIILARRRVAFLQDLFLGVVLTVILVLFAIATGEGRTEWALFLTYVVAIQFALSAMRTFFSLLTGFTRFLPQLERLMAADVAADARARGRDDVHPCGGAQGDSTPTIRAKDAPDQGASPRPWRIATASPRLRGSSSNAPVERRQCILLRLPAMPTPRSLGDLIRRLGADLPDADRAGFCGYVSQLPPVRPQTIEALASHRGLDAQTLRAELESTTDSAPLDPALARLAWMLLATLTPEIDVIVIDERLLARMDDATLGRAKRACGDRLIIVASTGAISARRLRPQLAVVAGAQGVEGIGDIAWYDAIAEELSREPRFGKTRGEPSGEPDDDDED